MKTHGGYQFAKSGLNSRSAVPAKGTTSFNDALQQFADRSRQHEPHSRRDSNTGKSTNRVLFDKQQKPSGNHSKDLQDSSFSTEPKNIKSSASQDHIISFKNRLKAHKTTEKKDPAQSLTAALENVQRLNEEIKNQSRGLRQSTSFAMLEQQRKNQNLDSGSVSRRQAGRTSVNSIDVSLN